MKLSEFVQKGFRRIKKMRFIQRFEHFELSSGFGTDGAGKSCTVVGAKHISVGGDSAFGPGCEVIALDSHFGQKLSPRLSIGKHVRATARCRITCAGTIEIEDDVLMAPDVFITDHSHGMNPDTQGGYSKQPLIVKSVHIGEGVWLGQRVCVLPGVTIGEHSIIGANSVVTHDIPAYSIAVGTPARVVKRWDDKNMKWVACQST